MKSFLTKATLLFCFIAAPISYVPFIHQNNEQQQRTATFGNEEAGTPAFPSYDITIDSNSMEDKGNIELNLSSSTEGGIDKKIVMPYSAGFYKSTYGEEAFQIRMKAYEEDGTDEVKRFFKNYYWTVTPPYYSDERMLNEYMLESEDYYHYGDSNLFEYAPNELSEDKDFKITIPNLYSDEFSILLILENIVVNGKSYPYTTPLRFNVKINTSENKNIYSSSKYDAYMKNDLLTVKQKSVNYKNDLNKTFIKNKNIKYSNILGKRSYYLNTSFNFDGVDYFYRKKLNNYENPAASFGNLSRNQFTGEINTLQSYGTLASMLFLNSNKYQEKAIIPSSFTNNIAFKESDNKNPTIWNEDLENKMKAFTENLSSAFLDDPDNEWFYKHWVYIPDYSSDEFEVIDTPETREVIKNNTNLFKRNFENSYPYTWSLGSEISSWDGNSFSKAINENQIWHKLSIDDNYYPEYSINFNNKSYYLRLQNESNQNLKNSRKWVANYIQKNIFNIDNGKVAKEIKNNANITLEDGFKTANSINGELENSSNENSFYNRRTPTRSINYLRVKDGPSFLSVPEIISITLFAISLIIVAALMALFIYKNSKENKDIVIISNNNEANTEEKPKKAKIKDKKAGDS